MDKEQLQDMLDDGRLEVFCPMCETNDIGLLGILGRKVALRCRACGWQFFRPLYKAEAR